MRALPFLLLSPLLAFAQAQRPASLLPAPVSVDLSSLGSSLLPTTDEGISLGSTSKRFAYLFVAGIKQNSGVARFGSAGSAGNTYKGEAPDGASAVGHDFDTSATYSTAGSKIVRILNNGTVKMYFDANLNRWIAPQAAGSGYGQLFGANFTGMRIQPNDNTLYFHTGAVFGGGHIFADSAGNPYAKMQSEGVYIGDPLGPTAKLILMYGTSASSPGAATINRAMGRAAIANSASSAVITNAVCVAATNIVQCKLETAGVGAVDVRCVAGVGSFTATAIDSTGAAAAVTGNATFSFVVYGNQ